jgi:hypothetical protein
MATKKSGGGGFASKSASTSSGYVTLFEKVKNSAGGESKGLSWYKGTVKQLASQYKGDPSKLQRDEKRDRSSSVEHQDENVLRRKVLQGHLYFFEYEAKMKYLPYYDKYPLAYVLKVDGDAFWAANLHYIDPKKRLKVITNLKENRIDIPKKCIHKYISNHVQSLYLDLSENEWDTAIFIPVEDFVTSKQIPYDRQLVWNETDDTYYEKLKGQRVVKKYTNKN